MNSHKEIEKEIEKAPSDDISTLLYQNIGDKTDSQFELYVDVEEEFNRLAAAKTITKTTTQTITPSHSTTTAFIPIPSANTPSTHFTIPTAPGFNISSFNPNFNMPIATGPNFNPNFNHPNFNIPNVLVLPSPSPTPMVPMQYYQHLSYPAPGTMQAVAYPSFPAPGTTVAYPGALQTSTLTPLIQTSTSMTPLIQTSTSMTPLIKTSTSVTPLIRPQLMRTPAVIRTRPQYLSTEEYYNLSLPERNKLKAQRKLYRNYYRHHRQQMTRQRMTKTTTATIRQGAGVSRRTSDCNIQVGSSKLRSLLAHNAVTTSRNDVDQSIIDVSSQSPNSNHSNLPKVILPKSIPSAPVPIYTSPIKKNAPIYTSFFTKNPTSTTTLPITSVSTFTTTATPAMNLSSIIISPINLSQEDPFSQFILSATPSHISTTPTTPTHTTSHSKIHIHSNILIPNIPTSNAPTSKITPAEVQICGPAVTTPSLNPSTMITHNTLTESFKVFADKFYSHLQAGSSVGIIVNQLKDVNARIDGAIAECDVILHFLQGVGNLGITDANIKIESSLEMKNSLNKLKVAINDVLSNNR